MDKFEQVKDVWDKRAHLGIRSGTNDIMLTQIEQDYIFSEITANSRILDLGCGNALSLIRLAKEKKCSGVGVDFSEEMLAVARAKAKDEKLQDRIEFINRTLPIDTLDLGTFDFVLSNRTMINFPTKDDQLKLFKQINNLLNPGGSFLMLECSQQGNDYTNKIRQSLYLESIDPPWHNLYFDEQDVESWSTPEFRLKDLIHVSSTYNLISRIVYAKVAEITGEKLEYDSLLNTISLQLPSDIGRFGPVKCWVWEKAI